MKVNILRFEFVTHLSLFLYWLTSVQLSAEKLMSSIQTRGDHGNLLANNSEQVFRAAYLFATSLTLATATASNLQQPLPNQFQNKHFPLVTVVTKGSLTSI